MTSLLPSQQKSDNKENNNDGAGPSQTEAEAEAELEEYVSLSERSGSESYDSDESEDDDDSIQAFGLGGGKKRKKRKRFDYHSFVKDNKAKKAMRRRQIQQERKDKKEMREIKRASYKKQRKAARERGFRGARLADLTSNTQRSLDAEILRRFPDARREKAERDLTRQRLIDQMNQDARDTRALVRQQRIAAGGDQDDDDEDTDSEDIQYDIDDKELARLQKQQRDVVGGGGPRAVDTTACDNMTDTFATIVESFDCFAPFEPLIRFEPCLDFMQTTTWSWFLFFIVTFFVLYQARNLYWGVITPGSIIYLGQP